PAPPGAALPGPAGPGPPAPSRPGDPGPAALGAAHHRRNRRGPGHERSGGQEPAPEGVAAPAQAFEQLPGRGAAMTMSQSLSKSSGSSQARLLEELVEEITNKLQAGEPVSLEAYALAHPELAGLLREVLPALQVLAEVGSADAADPEAAGLP